MAMDHAKEFLQKVTHRSEESRLESKHAVQRGLDDVSRAQTQTTNRMEEGVSAEADNNTNSKGFTACRCLCMGLAMPFCACCVDAWV